MGIITKEQFEEYKKILHLYDDLSVDCIIEHYKIALINWSSSKFINECDLKLMVDAFEFLCGIEKNEKIDEIKLAKKMFKIINNQQEYKDEDFNADSFDNFYMLGYKISRKIYSFGLKPEEVNRIYPILYQLFVTIQFIEKQYEKNNLKIKTKKSEKNS